MALAAPVVPVEKPKGHIWPRIAPPRPLQSDISGIKAAATCMGFDLLPAQEVAALYLEARAPDGKHLYAETADIMGRQNGKTHLMRAVIHDRMEKGRRMMHTAQDRTTAHRTIFLPVAEHFEAKHPDLFPQLGRRSSGPRYANGEQSIDLTTGGSYRLVAPTANGGRGDSCHDLIVDEVRTLTDWDFMNAAENTLSLADAQTIYLSNMGTADSIVLNALRERRDSDPSLAYLEWSAEEGLDAGDPLGWAQSNPIMGYEPEELEDRYDLLVRAYRAAVLDKKVAHFETERLCRYAPTLLPALVSEGAWDALRGPLKRPTRTYMAIAVDPLMRRASAAVAGMQPDGSVGVRVIADVTGNPVNLDRFGPDLVTLARRQRVVGDAAFDPVTDLGLARHLRKRKAMTGAEFWNAASGFVQRVELGQIRWQDAEMVAEDLRYTARKEHSTGVFTAVRADDEHTNTAALAVMRAVWLASNPRLAPNPNTEARVR